MKKLIFLLVIFSTTLAFGQDKVILNSKDEINGKILNDEFGAVKMVVNENGLKDTVQILKTQVKKIVYGPETVFNRPVSVGFSPNLTFWGVRSQLNDILVSNNFDGTYTSWLFGQTTSQFPKVTSFLSLVVEGNYRLTKQNSLGLKFGIFNHLQAKGYNYDKGGHVEFKYFDVGLIPYFRWFNATDKFHIDIGPSLNLVSLKGEGLVPEVYQEGPSSEKRLIPGLALGAGFSIYEKSHSFLHLKVNYQFFIAKATLDPIYYVDFNEITTMVIPSEEVRLNQFSIGIIYGRKFNDWFDK
jgi:hypothetical protein